MHTDCWEWEGKDIFDLIQDMVSVGSGGRFGNGRANIYILDNAAMDISRLEGREVYEWEEKCIPLGKYNRVKSRMEKGWVGGLGGQTSEGFLT